MLNVELEDTTTHAMYLTMLEVSQDKDNALDSHIPALFIHCTALQNPIWDLGLQFKFIHDTYEKKGTDGKYNLQSYTPKCIFP